MFSLPLRVRSYPFVCRMYDFELGQINGFISIRFSACFINGKASTYSRMFPKCKYTLQQLNYKNYITWNDAIAMKSLACQVQRSKPSIKQLTINTILVCFQYKNNYSCEIDCGNAHENKIPEVESWSDGVFNVCQIKKHIRPIVSSFLNICRRLGHCDTSQ